jgi:hypothetical protein
VLFASVLLDNIDGWLVVIFDTFDDGDIELLLLDNIDGWLVVVFDTLDEGDIEADDTAVDGAIDGVIGFSVATGDEIIEG